jgi:hypothetical protein
MIAAYVVSASMILQGYFPSSGGFEAAAEEAGTAAGIFGELEQASFKIAIATMLENVTAADVALTSITSMPVSSRSRRLGSGGTGILIDYTITSTSLDTAASAVTGLKAVQTSPAAFADQLFTEYTKAGVTAPATFTSASISVLTVDDTPTALAVAPLAAMTSTASSTDTGTEGGLLGALTYKGSDGITRTGITLRCSTDSYDPHCAITPPTADLVRQIFEFVHPSGFDVTDAARAAAFGGIMVASFERHENAQQRKQLIQAMIVAASNRDGAGTALLWEQSAAACAVAMSEVGGAGAIGSIAIEVATVMASVLEVQLQPARLGAVVLSLMEALEAAQNTNAAYDIAPTDQTLPVTPGAIAMAVVNSQFASAAVRAAILDVLHSRAVFASSAPLTTDAFVGGKATVSIIESAFTATLTVPEGAIGLGVTVTLRAYKCGDVSAALHSFLAGDSAASSHNSGNGCIALGITPHAFAAAVTISFKAPKGASACARASDELSDDWSPVWPPCTITVDGSATASWTSRSFSVVTALGLHRPVAAHRSSSGATATGATQGARGGPQSLSYAQQLVPEGAPLGFYRGHETSEVHTVPAMHALDRFPQRAAGQAFPTIDALLVGTGRNGLMGGLGAEVPRDFPTQTDDTTFGSVAADTSVGGGLYWTDGNKIWRSSMMGGKVAAVVPTLLWITVHGANFGSAGTPTGGNSSQSGDIVGLAVASAAAAIAASADRSSPKRAAGQGMHTFVSTMTVQGVPCDTIVPLGEAAVGCLMAGSAARLTNPNRLRLADVHVSSDRYGEGFLVIGGAQVLATKRAERHTAPMLAELRVNDLTVDGGAVHSSEGAAAHKAATAAGSTAHTPGVGGGEQTAPGQGLGAGAVPHKPHAIAIDTVARKLYWSDAGSHAIWRADLSSGSGGSEVEVTGVELVVLGARRVRAIAVDNGFEGEAGRAGLAGAWNMQGTAAGTPADESADTHMYFSEANRGWVCRVSKDAGAHALDGGSSASAHANPERDLDGSLSTSLSAMAFMPVVIPAGPLTQAVEGMELLHQGLKEPTGIALGRPLPVRHARTSSGRGVKRGVVQVPMMYFAESGGAVYRSRRDALPLEAHKVRGGTKETTAINRQLLVAGSCRARVDSIVAVPSDDVSKGVGEDMIYWTEANTNRIRGCTVYGQRLKSIPAGTMVWPRGLVAARETRVFDVPDSTLTNSSGDSSRGGLRTASSRRASLYNDAHDHRGEASAGSLGAENDGCAHGMLAGSGSWCAAQAEQGEWYELDAGMLRSLAGLAIKGRSDRQEWVSTLRVSVSINGTDGSWVEMTPSVASRAPTIAAAAGVIRGENNGKLLEQVEVDADGHMTRAQGGGVGSSTPGSSATDHGHGHEHATNGQGGGHGGDPGTIRQAPHGVPGSSAHLMHGDAATMYQTGSSASTSSNLFRGNADSDSTVELFFERPITARYVRLHPTSWEGWVSLRAALLVRDEVSQLFWTQYLGTISRANSDGSGAFTIVDSLSSKNSRKIEGAVAAMPSAYHFGLGRISE